MSEFIYTVRDAETGKLVSDITNPRRKYWDRKGNCEAAIQSYRRGYSGHGNHKEIEMVTLRLVEVTTE